MLELSVCPVLTRAYPRWRFCGLVSIISFANRNHLKTLGQDRQLKGPEAEIQIETLALLSPRTICMNVNKSNEDLRRRALNSCPFTFAVPHDEDFRALQGRLVPLLALRCL